MSRYRNSWLLAVLCIVALGCGGGDKKKDNADGDKGGPSGASALDASFIPADAVAVVVAHPAAILASELLADAPLDEPLTEIKENLGFDPKNVEQIVVPFYANPDAGAAVIVRTKEPYDKETVGGRMFTKERRQDAEHEGKKYIQAMRTSWDKEGNEGPLKPTGNAMFFADDKTVILGLEAPLKKMMVADSADSALIKQLKAAESHDIVILADTASARDVLKKLSKTAKASDKGELATWAADHVTSVSAWIDASPKLKLHVAIDSDDDAAGERLKKESDEGIAMLNEIVNKGGASLLKNPDSPLPAELADKIVKLGLDALAGIKTEGKDGAFEVTFEEPADTRAVWAELTPVLKKMEAESRARAQAMQIRSEMFMIAHALESYRIQYGSFPPSDPAKAAEHVGKIFKDVPKDAIATEIAAFDGPARALTFWLGGVSDDPTKPFTGKNRDALIEFDPKRIADDGSVLPRVETITTPFTYESDGETIKITHPGLDGKRGTNDDLIHPDPARAPPTDFEEKGEPAEDEPTEDTPDPK